MVKEDGKIYRVDGYGHRAEAGYLQMKEDGKTVKAVDGYGHEKPGKLVVKEDGKVYRYRRLRKQDRGGVLADQGRKIYRDDGTATRPCVRSRKRKVTAAGCHSARNIRTTTTAHDKRHYKVEGTRSTRPTRSGASSRSSRSRTKVHVRSEPRRDRRASH